MTVGRLSEDYITLRDVIFLAYIFETKFPHYIHILFASLIAFKVKQDVILAAGNTESSLH